MNAFPKLFLGLTAVLLAPPVASSDTKIDCSKLTSPQAKCMCEMKQAGIGTCAAFPLCVASSGFTLTGYNCRVAQAKTTGASAQGQGSAGVLQGAQGSGSVTYISEGGVSYEISFQAMNPVPAPPPSGGSPKSLGTVTGIDFSNGYIAVGTPAQQNLEMHLWDVILELEGQRSLGTRDPALELALEESHPDTEFFAVRIDGGPYGGGPLRLQFRLVPAVPDLMDVVPDATAVTWVTNLPFGTDEEWTLVEWIDHSSFSGILAFPVVPQQDVNFSGGLVPTALLAHDGVLGLSALRIANWTAQPSVVSVDLTLHDERSVIATATLSDLAVPAFAVLDQAIDVSLGDSLLQGAPYRLSVTTIDQANGSVAGSTLHLARVPEPEPPHRLYFSASDVDPDRYVATLFTGPQHVGKPYYMLCSVSGFGAGVPLNASTTLPLAFDGATNVMLMLPAANPLFDGYHGVIQPGGYAEAAFDRATLEAVAALYGAFPLTIATVVLGPPAPAYSVSNAILHVEP